MQALIAPLKELAEYGELYRERKKEPGMLRVTGCVNSQKTHMMYALSENIRYKVVVCAGESKAKQVYEEYRSWIRRLIFIRRRIFFFIRLI